MIYEAINQSISSFPPRSVTGQVWGWLNLANHISDSSGLLYLKQLCPPPKSYVSVNERRKMSILGLDKHRLLKRSVQNTLQHCALICISSRNRYSYPSARNARNVKSGEDVGPVRTHILYRHFYIMLTWCWCLSRIWKNKQTNPPKQKQKQNPTVLETKKKKKVLSFSSGICHMAQDTKYPVLEMI